MSGPSHADEGGLATAARLRLEFDRAFAAAPSADAGTRTAYLAIQIGGDPFALRMSDLLGVHVDRKIAPVPATAPTLLGIASFRGALTPVHDLRLLLGYPTRAQVRWLARIAGTQPIALAFDALEGQFAVADGGAAGLDVAGARDGAGARPAAPGVAAFTRGLVQGRGALRPVIDVGPVVAALARNHGRTRPPTER